MIPMADSSSGDQTQFDEVTDNNINLSILIQSDVLACDLLWSLFVAAAKSYRIHSILRPCPSMYKPTDEEKNIFALRDAVSRVPPLSEDSNFESKLSPDCKDLLTWVLDAKKFYLKSCDKDTGFKVIKDLTGQVMNTDSPDYIFEIVYCEDKEKKFQQLRGSRKLFYGYHGSRFDNFYSILHNGLISYLNKVAAFGEGTYLSSELSVSLLYSPNGEGWKNSRIGSRLSCVAVCQIIDDSSVKYQLKEGSAAEQKGRSRASKIDDAVPEKYYVVQNNDVIRVKYLMVYKHHTAPAVSSRSVLSSWVQDHKFYLLMLAYFVLLAAIGLMNSRNAINTISRFYKSFNF